MAEPRPREEAALDPPSIYLVLCALPVVCWDPCPTEAPDIAVFFASERVVAEFGIFMATEFLVLALASSAATCFNVFDVTRW